MPVSPSARSIVSPNSLMSVSFLAISHTYINTTTRAQINTKFWLLVGVQELDVLSGAARSYGTNISLRSLHHQTNELVPGCAARIENNFLRQESARCRQSWRGSSRFKKLSIRFSPHLIIREEE